MFDIELRRVTRIIHNRYKRGHLDNKEIYIFGVSDSSRQIIQVFRELGSEPSFVIDNDKKKQGSYCSRLRVISPSEVSNPGDGKKVFVIYATSWREMVPQLKSLGVRDESIWGLNHSKGRFEKALYYAYRGRRYYKKLKMKYGDVPIFLCPYTGTGDIYLIGTFWEEYLKRNSITEYVFVVVSGACKKVAEIFDIKNIETTNTKEDADALIAYYRYNPEEGRIKILNDGWGPIHTNQVSWLRGYKGLYFTQVFRKYVFDLPDDIKPKHPILKDQTDLLKGLFEEKRLVPGRTVILSPYSNTLSDLSERFWEELTVQLKNAGYCVGTNCGGVTEPAINGTIGLMFPLNIAPQFVEMAGAFIGVRSGFCDVISGTKAKKVILYDAKNRFFQGSAFEYFSLKGMEFCDDAVEIEFDNDRIDKICCTIMKSFVD